MSVLRLRFGGSSAECRLHGPGCRTPWGYDQAHTDSPRPYPLNELAEREQGPHRFAYSTTEAYELGWYTWRALRRDAEPTRAERDAAFEVLEAHLSAHPRRSRG
ncbi:hypothetical protein ACFW81_23905 [Streptomyces angustmyceticus]|uniref:hypothetical protein n=1 Tax=Streptomyces angustmyceticus TaxID=285578 RepID=UPI0036BDD280